MLNSISLYFSSYSLCFWVFVMKWLWVFFMASDWFFNVLLCGCDSPRAMGERMFSWGQGGPEWSTVWGGTFSNTSSQPQLTPSLRGSFRRPSSTWDLPDTISQLSTTLWSTLPETFKPASTASRYSPIGPLVVFLAAIVIFFISSLG